MVFDEFSVFAGEQVLNLVNMGRGKGVHAIFGTQGLADLSRVDRDFKSQILNCANTIICHQLNDQESVETISSWMGTEDSFVTTAQYNPNSSGVGLGSIKEDKRFIVHPEQIKQGLGVGEAFLVSKVGGFVREKVRVQHVW
jgi:type IV secretory pathway TraG/TraD family ATPase VirD4